MSKAVCFGTLRSAQIRAARLMAAEFYEVPSIVEASRKLWEALEKQRKDNRPDTK